MRYLLDTNFVSELRKGERANRGVQAWTMANDPTQWALSVITIGEIRTGIEDCRASEPRQAAVLEKWLAAQVTEFSVNILAVTLEIADRWGRLMSATELPDNDLLLAATALEHDLTVVTRDVADFRGSGVRLLNPWK
jgi:hypothetical protein